MPGKGNILVILVVIVFVLGGFMFFKPKNNVQEEVGFKAVINGVSIDLEVARSSMDKAEGLSGRKSLDENSGMLFPFSPRVQPGFWMIDMNFPLDMIWIREGKIVAISENAAPEPDKKPDQLKKYYPPVPIDYVLEVNGGFCQKNNIKVGDSVEFSGI